MVVDLVFVDYECVVDDVDLVLILVWEWVLCYDVKVCIEEFNVLVGYEYVYKGMISCDLIENVE